MDQSYGDPGSAPGPTYRTYDDLVAWAQRLVGTALRPLDVSEPHGRSLVVELIAGDGRRWYLKHPRDPARYDRELAAYRTALPALGDLVPQLVGAEDAERLLLVTGVEGQPAGRAHVDDLAVQRQAGAWLRRLHGTATAVRSPAPVEQLGQELAELVVRAADVLEPSLLHAVRARAAAALADPAPLVTWCHGDFGPRNWLVDDLGVVRVIDFGQSRPDAPARDLARLTLFAWNGRPDLRAAFLEGYGRPPVDLDPDVIDAYAATVLLAAAARAHEAADRQELRRATRRLSRLLAGRDG